MIAFLLSDIHFRLHPPVVRIEEPNWFAAMARPWEQLIQESLVYHRAPIIIAGDIFDRWNSTPELINFVLKTLPHGMDIYAIPGQHDLPFHNYSDRHRSAYWTLVESGRIKTIEPGVPLHIPNLILHGFPWEHAITPCSTPPHTFGLNLAVCHTFVWTKKTGFPGAPPGGRLKHFLTKLKGYDACVVGDNHCGFLSASNPQCPILNNGSILRMNVAQKDYKPSYGVLYADGVIERKYFDTKEDKFLEIGKELKGQELSELDLSDFLDELRDLGHTVSDFAEAMNLFFKSNKIRKKVKSIILNALGWEHGK